MTFELLNAEEHFALSDRFIKDLESFSVFDTKTGTLQPVICSVCDSVPDCAQWYVFVGMKQAKMWFRRCHLQKGDIVDEYPNMDSSSHDMNPLITQYTTKYRELDEFVLSPMTFVNEKNEVLLCKSCKDELERISKRKSGSRLCMPEYAISNNRLVGDAPNCIKKLSEVALSLISIARIYCQSWVFFCGCHQHIKGWHTFYKNRVTENIGNLMQIRDAGMRGSVLVVLCGPFTKTQKALTLDACSVNPLDVVNALRWLIANNFQYRNERIPHVDEIPMPHVIYENL